MSLPNYEPTKYDYKTKEKGPPPKYEELVPTIKKRDITFSILIWTSDVLCFTSPNSATKYESFKKANKRDANFKQVISLQQLGIGLPLTEGQFRLFFGLGDTKFGTILKCVPPPADSNRIFNKKKDKFKFCAIRKQHEKRHTRYTFTILPNQYQPSDTFQFSMFVHSKLPIIDVTPIPGSHRRYRWICTNSSYLSEDFTYTLYTLDEKQESMVDNMDIASKKLDKTNRILNADFCQFPKEKIQEYKSLGKVEELRMLLKIGCDPLYLPKDKVGELTRKEGNNKVIMSTLQEGNRSLHVSQQQDVDLESINSVGVHELALTCMSYVINFIEEERIQRNKSS